jgi:hypothetical protein
MLWCKPGGGVTKPPHVYVSGEVDQWAEVAVGWVVWTASMVSYRYDAAQRAACSAAAVESGPDLAEVAQHRQGKGSDSGHREEMV